MARLNSEVTTGAEGIELVESKDYVDEATGNPGRYTKKVYHLESRVPGWVKLLAPSSALKLDEESWDAFPSCKTVITNRFFGERFQLTIESRHFDMDRGEQENALDLSEDQLKKRVVSMVDIGADQPTDKNEYKESEDPRLFKSEKFDEQFQPLTEGWKERVDPYMCCYKVVTILFKIWGVQGKGESFLMDMESQIFLKFHKEIFCWLDDWYGLSVDEIIAKEKSFYDAMEDVLSVDDDGQDGEGSKKDKKKKSKKDRSAKGSNDASSSDANAQSSSSSAPPTDDGSEATSPETISAATSTETSVDAESSGKKKKKSKKKSSADLEIVEETVVAISRVSIEVEETEDSEIVTSTSETIVIKKTKKSKKSREIETE